MKTLKGFTMIELMIIIAILGILMAIAIPAWQDYEIRKRECTGPHHSVCVDAFMQWKRARRDVNEFQFTGAAPTVSVPVPSYSVEPKALAHNVTVTEQCVNRKVVYVASTGVVTQATDKYNNPIACME